MTYPIMLPGFVPQYLIDPSHDLRGEFLHRLHGLQVFVIDAGEVLTNVELHEISVLPQERL